LGYECPENLELFSSCVQPCANTQKYIHQTTLLSSLCFLHFVRIAVAYLSYLLHDLSRSVLLSFLCFTSTACFYLLFWRLCSWGRDGCGPFIFFWIPQRAHDQILPKPAAKLCRSDLSSHLICQKSSLKFILWFGCFWLAGEMTESIAYRSINP
jgi:hypothetical protein